MYRQLNQQQSAFAAQHCNLVDLFLQMENLPSDEYYDTVVFGYLDAVQEFLEYKQTAEQDFKTLAYDHMRNSLSSVLTDAPDISLILESDLTSTYGFSLEELTDLYADTANLAINRICNEEMIRSLNSQEQDIFRLVMDGYSARAICRCIGIPNKELTNMLDCILKKSKQITQCA